MDSLINKKGWFSEVNSQWPGQAMSIEIEETLHDEKSKYQHVQVFKTKKFGNMLVLDGVIQITERDECAYQEMITHIPMFSHANPEVVLIVGGGDGGVIREVIRHKSVKELIICEIDQMVIDVSKKYFKTMSSSWDDKRLTVVCMDASEYLKSDAAKEKFDVIVCDSSDPVGPAQALFESPFYKSMNNALRAGGRIATQAESVWNNRDLIQDLFRRTLDIFETVEYATTQIPTYPCGQIGFLCCAKAGGSKTGMKVPARAVPADMAKNLEYYTSELHVASFVLPAFMNKLIQTAREETKKPLEVVDVFALSAAAEEASAKKNGGRGRKRKQSTTKAAAAASAGDDDEEEKAPKKKAARAPPKERADLPKRSSRTHKKSKKAEEAEADAAEEEAQEPAKKKSKKSDD